MSMKTLRLRSRLTAGALSVSLAVPPAAWSQPAAAPAPEGRAATAGAGHSPTLRSRTLVTVNFVNADVEAVTRAFAAMIQRQIAVDPRVKGTITVYSEQPLTIREAYLNYLSALRGLGFSMVESGGLLKVVPEADAKLQAGTVAVGEVPVRGDQILTQIFNLRYENPNNLVTVLRPLISANNTINASPGSNALVITDYADNLQRIARIIAALDQPAQTDFEVVPLKHALALDIAPLVQRLTDAGSAPTQVVPGVPGAAGAASTIVPEPRSNSLLVRAPNAARLASILAAIQKLDRPTPGSGPGGNIWVVHLKNADATRMATVLRAAFPGSGGSAGGGGGGGGSGIQPTPTPAGAAGGQPGAASPQATAPISGAAAPSTGGFVQADPATNSLIITAPEPLYRQVRAMIDQLDTRRAQVYIESMIVEVSGDNAADFGFQWQGILGNRGDSNLLAGGTNFNTGGGNIISLQTGALAGKAQLPEGLNIGLIRNFGGTYALAAIARALQSQTNTNIISTPNQITLDNEEAKIVVGSNVPFITGQFTNTGGSSTSINPFQTIERKDVGLTLRVRPQIGEGGTVRMSIYLESSSVSEKVAPGTSNAGPSTNKRQIESNVVVDDGGIIVLGGLIEDRFVESRSKVPLLGDLPVVGGLFRSESRSKNRTNLMVFLRPVVLRDAASGERLTLDRYDLIRAQQQASQPETSPLVPIPGNPVLPPAGSSAPGGGAPRPAAPSSPAGAPAGPAAEPVRQP
ncbi:MAG: putative ral secretion pathway protein GspD [Pseudomonadota bacterium]|jgi:general secretion pathway protein D